MLPRNLSEDLLSLHEHQLRPTITVTTPLDENFEIGEPTFELTKLENNKRFSYDAVDKVLVDPTHPTRQLLYPYGELALKLLLKRRERGALAFYDLSKRIATNEEGTPRLLTEEEAHISNIIIQEFMILTNKSVALYLAENQVPTLFRNHKARANVPSRESLLRNIENAINQQEAFDASVLTSRMGVTFDRASYGPTLEGHYGLNLKAYLHFTSPIRRYADLATHRILTAVIKNENPPYSMEELAEIGNHLNTATDSVQRQRSGQFKQSTYQAPYLPQVAIPEVIGQNRRDAEKAAAKKIFEKLKQEFLLAQTQSKKSKPIERADGNSIGALNTFIIRHHLRMPTYNTSLVGKSPESGFECTVRIRLPDDRTREFKAYGSNHNSARQNAARIMFEELSQS